MNFSAALIALRDGLAVRRSGWNGKHYLTVQLPDEHSANTEPYIVIHPEGGGRTPWVASHADLLRDDWDLFGAPDA